MTFLVQEQSQADGRPVELFLFIREGQSSGVGFTNAEDEITFDNTTYEPIGITRTEQEYSNESDASAITIQVPRDEEFVRQFIIIPPGDRYVVTVYRRHISDAGLQTVTWWKGYISQVKFEGFDCFITCKSILELFTRIGPRMNFQQPCNHLLYDGVCRVTETSFRYQAVPTSVSADGTQLTFTGLSTSPPLTSAPAGFQASFYVGGFIRSFDAIDHRLITAQSGDTLTIQFPFFETPAGQQLDVLAGCDHQILTCRDKFSNLANYGGHAYLPVRNIFTKGLDSTGT